MWYFYRDKAWSALYSIILASVLSALSFGLVYFISYRYVADGTELSEFMYDFWKDGFFQLNFEWLIRFPFFIFRSIAELTNPVLLVIVVFGIVIGSRLIKRQYAVTLLLIILITLLASSLHFYPLAERLLLFLIPGVFLICASGLGDVYLKLKLANSKIAYILVIFVSGLFIWQIHPGQYFEETRHAYEYVYAVSEREPRVFISPETVRVARFYSYPYQTLSALSIGEPVQAARQSNSPVWMVMIERHLNRFPPDERLNLVPEFHFHQIYAFCFDGTELACPDK